VNSTKYETSLPVLAGELLAREVENDHFLAYVKGFHGASVDAIVHEINKDVSTLIDCTSCGNCCKSLMIHITADEIRNLSTVLQKPEQEIQDIYIEKSLAGQFFMNTIPCHFLNDNKCTIYPDRFTECREFPHLHKDGFKERMLGTMLHYGSCPIVYNVVEQLKIKLDFHGEHSEE
jgi:uncharacterized protein